MEPSYVQQRASLIPARVVQAEIMRMSRLPRPDVAGVAQHVIQRGNNRMPCFFDDVDRQDYLRTLLLSARRCKKGTEVIKAGSYAWLRHSPTEIPNLQSAW